MVPFDPTDEHLIPPPGGDPTSPETRRFLLELARSLHRHGTPAHRLERALTSAARRLGIRAEFFTTPTSIMVGIGPVEQQHVHLLRVEPGEPNLAQLAELGDITRLVTEGALSPAEGLARIDAMDRAPATYAPWLVILAFVLSSMAVASFLKVRVGDLLIASALGLITGIIVLRASRGEATRHVIAPLAAFVVSTTAFLADKLLGTSSGYATSLAGLVILFPGFTFTIALTELSTRHLASGTARLSGAMITFLGLGFGLALGVKAGSALGAVLTPVLPLLTGLTSTAALPAWSEGVALLIAPLAFTVLLNGPPRDAGLIVLACAAAYLTSKFAGAAMGEELGAFLGAFVVSAGSTLLARWRQGVAMVTQVPGLLILVPGSIGFRSVAALLGQEVEAGIMTAFRLAIIGISLAAGILAGNIVVRSRRVRI
ncbi:MAG: hypothetical protein RLZZ621_1173 [Gemmatimonadota bacterium]|jgi:uncharacterized membrane protein YjjP (DUF1212 family)